VVSRPGRLLGCILAGLLLVPALLAAAVSSALIPTPPVAGGAVGLANAARTAGFSGQRLRVAVAVGLAESGGNPQATSHNPPTAGCPAGSRDRGGWQLNDCHHPQVADGCAYQLGCAAAQAFRISAGGRAWGQWTTYRTGGWRTQLPAADAAIAALGAGRGVGEPCPLAAAAQTARVLVVASFGPLPIHGCATAGHIQGSDHYSDTTGYAHAIDVMTGPDRPLNQRIAAFLVANAEALQVKYVIAQTRIWTPQRGWRPYLHPSCTNPATCSPTLQHLDHVHLSTR
jgi:hypothetical protein